MRTGVTHLIYCGVISVDSGNDVRAAKPPRTFLEQVEILKNRNLIVEDEPSAIDILSRVNYYRLSGYGLSFRAKENKSKKLSNQFKPGTTFNTVFRVYEFDRKLRILFYGLLEQIEISARTSIAHYLSHMYQDSLCYEDETIFEEPSRHSQFMSKVNVAIEDARRGRELFVRHHDAHYSGKLPIWSLVELLSFGTLSIFYSNLKSEHKRGIADRFYGVPYRYLQSWWRTLCYTRNTCAHYSRLYNKPLSVTPELFPEDKATFGNRRIFAAIFVSGIICPDEMEWATFENNLETLIEAYSEDIELWRLGFPQNWKNLLRDTIMTRRFTLAANRIKQSYF